MKFIEKIKHFFLHISNKYEGTVVYWWENNELMFGFECKECKKIEKLGKTGIRR